MKKVGLLFSHILGSINIS